MPDKMNITRMAAHNIPTPEHWILEYDQESNLEEDKGLSKHVENCWSKTEWIEDLELDSITCCFNQLENGPNLTHRSIRSVFNLPDDIQFFSTKDLVRIQNNPTGIVRMGGNLEALFAMGFPVTEYIHHYLISQYDLDRDLSIPKRDKPGIQDTLANSIAYGSRKWLRSILSLTAIEQVALFQVDLQKSLMFRMGDLPTLDRRFQREGKSRFLFSPIWNCSLDYLHKLGFGFWLLSLEISISQSDKKAEHMFLPNTLLLHMLLNNLETAVTKSQIIDHGNTPRKISLIRLLLNDTIKNNGSSSRI